MIGFRLFVACIALVAMPALSRCSSAPELRDNVEAQTPEPGAPPSSQGIPIGTVPQADPKRFAGMVRPFFEEHCLDCHGGSKPKADFRIGELSSDFDNLATRAQWVEIVDMLNSHEMPPDTEPQPDQRKVAQVVDWITKQLVRSELEKRASAAVLRRLNREEYRNTIRELTGVEFDVSGFPMDPTAGGFDNIGAALSVSPLHVELYLDAAREILDRALVQGPRPAVRRWRFEAEAPDSPPNYTTPDGMRVTVRGGVGGTKHGARVLKNPSWDRAVFAKDFQLPSAGEYIIRVRAAGVVPSRAEVIASAEPFLKQRLLELTRKDPKGKAWHIREYQQALEHFRTDRMYDYGPPRLELTQELGGQPEIVSTFDVDAPHDQPTVYEFRVHFTTERAAIRLEYAYDIPSVLENFRFQGSDAFKRPEVLLDWYEIEGPVYEEEWPPPSRKLLLGEFAAAGEPKRGDVERLLARFMTRAYRRPVNKAEVAEKVALYEQCRKQGASFVEGLKVPLVAVLISPNFLYLVEPVVLPGPTNAGDQRDRRLTDYELASRLSYFLWSSMPDTTLFALAGKGVLSQKPILNAQIDRMLEDPKSHAFVQNFAGQWLGLREVGGNPPVPQRYPRYDRHLEKSIVEEGRAFFEEILRKDLSVMNFVKSDFVVVNERLARFYGLFGVSGDRFRRVPVPEGVPRGGVLTQAAMLSITSNGTRTSPVKRGVWVLRNVLGIDPGKPVANAGEIAPKVPGIDKATVRQRLEIHRSLPQCARCHDKMDPLGFALENFNASGEWREKEATGWRGRTMDSDPPVDASATLPDGTKFFGVQGLQTQLLKKRELFLRCLAGKMLTYALGRELTLSDQHLVVDAAQHLASGHDSLRSLIRFIVSSRPFQTT